MAWATQSAVKAAIAARLGKQEADLESQWDAIAKKSVADAKADVTTIMLTLGYTFTQVESWDFLETYHERLAIYFAFNTPPVADPGQAEKALDVRDQLRQMTALIIDGAAVAPSAATDVGGIAYGRQKVSEDSTLDSIDDILPDLETNLGKYHR